MKKFYTSILFIVALLLTTTAFARVELDQSKSTAPQAIEPYKYVQDFAGILDDADANSLNEKLTKMSEELEFDIVVLTSTGVESDARMAYADDFFDYNYYGYNDCQDGVVLLVNVDENGVWTPGNSWVSTKGKGEDAIDDDDISDIGSALKSSLEYGDYAFAFELFASQVEGDLNSYKAKGMTILIAVTILFALIAAFWYTGKLKKELISVEDATEADAYMVDGSLNITRSYDHFLYANVTRVKKESKSSSSHTSSSGSSHGGGGF